MLYFAYGSNMSLRRLKARCPSAIRICSATLPEHQLRWHKPGADGTGKCDAWFTGHREDVLHGVLFHIDDRDAPTLDAFEGRGKHYTRQLVSVKTERFGWVRAVTYYALAIDSRMKPAPWYKDYVLTGAIEAGLPSYYVDRIRRQKVAPAPRWTPSPFTMAEEDADASL